MIRTFLPGKNQKRLNEIFPLVDANGDGSGSQRDAEALAD